MADAVLRHYQQAHNEVQFRWVETFTDTHPIDFRLEWRFVQQWLPEFYFEVKVRLKQYDPFKISSKKLRTAFAIAKRDGIPLMLWVSFTDTALVRGILLDDLNFCSTTIGHGSRHGNLEESFDIPIDLFKINIQMPCDLEVSPNSFR